MWALRYGAVSAVLGLVLILAPGCGGPEPITFLVDVVTDLQPGAAFDHVQTALYVDGAAVPLAEVDRPATAGDPFARGVRVAMFDNRSAGTYRVEVALTRAGVEVARARERFMTSTTRGVTVRFEDAVADAGVADAGPPDGGLVEVCRPDFADCDGDPTNGCETSLLTVTNCGMCGFTCDSPDAAATCAMGICLLNCDPGYSDCDGDPTNGCETSLLTVTNCGMCGFTCDSPDAATTCAMGICLLNCEPGYGDCDGDPTNGCEMLLNTLTDCGACGMRCSLPHASSSCGMGVCLVETCAPGFSDCDAEPANGCETSLRTVSDCGICGMRCSLPHASSSCGMGVCLVETCAPGFSDCDANPLNGCESSSAC